MPARPKWGCSDPAAGSGRWIMCEYCFPIRISNTYTAEVVAHTFHRTGGESCDSGSTEGLACLKNPTVVRGSNIAEVNHAPSQQPRNQHTFSYTTQWQLSSLMPISGSPGCAVAIKCCCCCLLLWTVRWSLYTTKHLFMHHLWFHNRFRVCGCSIYEDE